MTYFKINRDGRSGLLQRAFYHNIVEAAEEDDSEYGDAAHCRIALYKSAVTIAAGHMGELEYPEHKGTRTSGTPRSTRISRTHRN